MSVEQLFNFTNPQYSNLWEFAIIPDNLASVKSNPLALLQANRLRFLAQSVNLPFLGFETEKTNTGASFITGFNPEGEITIDFLETRDFTVLNYFKDWQDEIYDREKRVWNRGNHRRTGVLTFLQPLQSLGGGVTGEIESIVRNFTPELPNLPATPDLGIGQPRFRPVKLFLLKGFIIKSIAEVPLDYQSSDQLSISVTLDVNRIEEPFDQLQRRAIGGALDRIF